MFKNLERLKSLDYVFISLLILAASSVFTSSLSLAVAVVCFTGLRAFDKWTEKQAVGDLNAEVKQELQDVKNYVATMSIRQANARPQQEKPSAGQRLF